MNVEYVVTEENDEDDDDEEDEESDDANIYDEIAIKKEEEEFANLDKILMKQVRQNSNIVLEFKWNLCCL